MTMLGEHGAICPGGALRTTEESLMASATLIAAVTAWVGGVNKNKNTWLYFLLTFTIMVKMQ